MGLQLLDVAKTKERIGPASRFAASEFKKIGLTVTAKEADVAALEEQQAKNKNAEVKFLLSFDGKSVLYWVECAGKKTTLATLELAKAGRPGVQRAIIEKLVKNSAAADASDLEKFNKAHPPPPTADEQGKLQRAITPLRMQLRDKLAAAKKLADEIKDLQKQIEPYEKLEKQFKERWDND